MKIALICGAGKIGRGFLGQLLHRSGYRLYFLDADPKLVDNLNRAKEYRVEIAGCNESRAERVPLARAFLPQNKKELEELVPRLDVLVTSVGAENLVKATRLLAELLAPRRRPLNWLLCENAPRPVEEVRRTLKGVLGTEAPLLAEGILGLVETQVLRSGVLPDQETLAQSPLTLRMTDWWTLPADGDALVGPPLQIEGLEPKANFAHEVRRKLYTFNGLNAPIAYVGFANGYRVLHEAARAPELEPFFAEIVAESAHGLIREYRLDRDEHLAFQRLAWEKYRDSHIRDTLARHARDSARKLGPEDRLLGPARLCLKHGRTPLAYSRAIAAAIAYDASDDPGTRRVQQLRQEGGLDAVLREVCHLPEESPLRGLIERALGAEDYRVET